MNLLCLNSRDELFLIDLDNVVCMKAEGNYTQIFHADGLKITVTLGLSKLEEQIRSLHSGSINIFIRLGRSIILNQRYLHGINVPKQKITLHGNGKNVFHLTAPKILIRQYKERIVELLSLNSNL